MLAEDRSIPTFKSKKSRRKDMIFKRGHSFLSSFQCVCGAGPGAVSPGLTTCDPMTSTLEPREQLVSLASAAPCLWDTEGGSA